MLASRTRKWCPQRLTSLSKVIPLEFFLAHHVISPFNLSLYLCTYQPKCLFLTGPYLTNLSKASLPHQCIPLLYTNDHYLKLFYLCIYFLFYLSWIKVSDTSIVSLLFHFISSTKSSAWHLLELNQIRWSRKRSTLYLSHQLVTSS